MNDEEIIDYIKKYFIYNDDGTFTRTDRKNSEGSLDKDGYLMIKIKGKKYRAHRLVYAYHNGHFPSLEIDHINRDRTNNRIENLREVDRQSNVDNTTKKINKDTGVVGIYKDKCTKGLRAVYTFHYKDKTYRFRTLEEAIIKKEELMNGK